MKPIDPSAALEVREAEQPRPERNVTARVFAIFASNWPHLQVSRPTLDLWATQLAGIPEDVAIEAAVRCVRECEFWPSVRTFLDAVTATTSETVRPVEYAPELPEATDPAKVKATIADARRALEIAEKKRSPK